MSDNEFVDLIKSQVGDDEPLSPTTLAAIGESAILDRQIVELARAGMAYTQIADHLDIPLPKLLNRIGNIVSTQSDMLSKAQMNDYLLYQLQLIGVGIENSLVDMSMEGDDKLAITARDKGRMALHKFLQHQAAITQLFRQKIEVDVRKVEISVVRSEDFDAL